MQFLVIPPSYSPPHAFISGKVIAMPATFDGKFSAAVLGEFWRAELLHPAATSDAAEMQYLRRLARAIVGRLLPRSEVQLAALRLLIEELLAVTLLKPLLANLATAQTNRALYVVASLIFKTCDIHTH